LHKFFAYVTCHKHRTRTIDPGYIFLHISCSTYLLQYTYNMLYIPRAMFMFIAACLFWN